MHFNFHLSGDESPEQSRRIANAVLALGGQLKPSTSVGGTPGDMLPITPGPTRYTSYDPASGAPAVPEPMTANELRELIVPSAQLPPSATLEVSNVFTTTDKNGLPWDERIHSSSRAINADGTWRYRKNVPDETKQAVEAELRGLVQAPQLTEADLPLVAPPPVVPVPPIPTVSPSVPVSTAQRSYSDVVNLIMANQATLNKPELYVAVLGMSLPEFAAACIAKPELATAAFNALDEIRRS